MDQVAGHVTNYRNLREFVEDDAEVEATWGEVSYYVPGGRIERTHERVLPFVPGYFSGNARGVVEMRRGLRARPVDALFSNTAVSVFFTRPLGRTPTLYDYDSTPLQLDAMPEYTPKPDPRPVRKLKFELTRRLLHGVALNQAWTTWAKRSAVEDYGVPAERVVVNPPGIDLRLWRHLERAPHDAGAGRPLRVLFVGNDFGRKGGDLLLGWASMQDPAAVELHVVSANGPEARPGVRVHRGLEPNSPELLALYRDADVFALPSRAECFGIATIEAMATGLPVVASDSGGTADIVEDGANGLIVPAGDGPALGRALDVLLTDANRRAAWGARSRQLVEERFDLRSNGKRTLDLLKALATGDHQGQRSE